MRCRQKDKIDLLEFGIRFEVVGYMLYRRLLDIQTVDDLIGGTIIGYWSRMKAWAGEHRAQTGHEEFLEWCQWAAIQLENRRGKRPYVAAYNKHTDWPE